MTYQAILIMGMEYKIVQNKGDKCDYLLIQAAGHPIDLIELAPGALGLSNNNQTELKPNANGCIGGRAVTCSKTLDSLLSSH